MKTPSQKWADEEDIVVYNVRIDHLTQAVLFEAVDGGLSQWTDELILKDGKIYSRRNGVIYYEEARD